jgi:hypothetical protein
VNPRSLQTALVLAITDVTVWFNSAGEIHHWPEWFNWPFVNAFQRCHDRITWTGHWIFTSADC